MADKEYRRLDKDQLDYLMLFLMTKLAASPLKDNTTYTLSQDAKDGHKITFTPSVGEAITITIPDSVYDDTAIKKEISGKADSDSLKKVATSGSYNDLTDKPTIPTVPANVTAFTNDAKYQTDEQVRTSIKTALSGITGITFSVVDALPATGAAGTFYLVPDTHSDANDAYDEYVWVTDAEETSKFEKIGNTDVDLSGYVKSSEMKVYTNAEIESAVNTAYTTVFGA